MKKKMMIAILTLALTAGAGFSMNAEASWLSKVLAPIGTSGTQSPAARESSRSNRWELIYQGENYRIYADRRTLKASGSAQHRCVEGYFKRVYTAEESYNLGANSRGDVKPDTVTHCIYKAWYEVSHSGISIGGNPKYYDAESHLIYEGFLSDFEGDGGLGRYTPESENEQIRDSLFRAFGMDY